MEASQIKPGSLASYLGTETLKCTAGEGGEGEEQDRNIYMFATVEEVVTRIAPMG